MAASSLSVLDSTGTAKTLGTITNAAGVQVYTVSGDVNVATYAASVNQITPVAAIKTCFLLPGNATTTVRVKKVVLSGIATAAAEAKFALKKTSDAGTLGSATLTAMTAAPFDSGMAAASSAPSYVQTAVYTTEPTSVGLIYTAELGMPATGSGVIGSQLEVNFGLNGVPALVLRGTAQLLIVDFLGATLASGAKYSCAFWWSEDAS